MQDLKLPLIFTDMDGTLYSSNFKASQETISDIKFATTKSEENPKPALFNLCTGNPVFERVKNVGKQLNARYLIGSTGASIFDMQKNEFIYQKTIDNEAAKKIIDFANKNQLEIIFWNSYQYFYSNFTNQSSLEATLAYHFDTDKGRDIVNQYKNQEINDIIKIEFICKPKYFKKITKFLKTINVYFIETSSNIEIMAKNISKGSAIKYIVETFYQNELSLEDVFCAGDSKNDVDMLKICGYSYAMANSPQVVKLQAKYHTSSVEQNGLGEAIIDYLYRLNKVIKKFLLH
ncbi:Cof-type HAD-IIB family hydrolase [Mycoplasma miroungirhinis]|uniref:Cof-type HAD-IIB family hydrolase n=1 Tax=Mycoplasma miroungirhinis TaxID=754516 RepID=A0A6M4JCY0_9MOLU|nr:Cof-type HAD-IIB family hydrolase [Mycoplasma miroungirhinis]QJR43886.1 Cof-type HAD-IIB family hydrolase [Mycoplasma miroungirhinis]